MILYLCKKCMHLKNSNHFQLKFICVCICCSKNMFLEFAPPIFFLKFGMNKYEFKIYKKKINSSIHRKTINLFKIVVLITHQFSFIPSSNVKCTMSFLKKYKKCVLWSLVKQFNFDTTSLNIFLKSINLMWNY